MATEFERDAILRDPKVYSVSEKLAELALDFAVFGYFDTSRDLVGILNEHNPRCHRHHENLKPLWFAWDLTSWPIGEKERVQESLSELQETYESDLERTFDRDSMAKLRDRLEDLRDTPNSDVEQSQLLAMMLEAAITVEGEEVESEQNVLETISKRLHVSYQMRCLAQRARIWPLMRDGTLARAFNLDHEKQKQLGELALKTFRQRFENGPLRSELESKPIKKLLEIISDNTVNEEGMKSLYDSQKSHPSTLLRDPLPLSEITALEARLGVSFPEDYKEFLSISNGLGAPWNGYYDSPPLFSASEHRWITDEEDYFTDLPSDLINIEGLVIVHVEDYELWPKVGRTIQIGSQDIDEVWLLPPSSVDRMRAEYQKILANADENVKKSVLSAIKDFVGSVEEFEKVDWCVVTWASGGSAMMQTYPNFKAFLVETAEASSRDKEDLE